MVENYRQRAYPERQPGVRVWVSQPTTWKHRSSVQLGPLGWLGVCFCAPCNCQLLLTSIFAALRPSNSRPLSRLSSPTVGFAAASTRSNNQEHVDRFQPA
jgi:hypothetical protein